MTTIMSIKMIIEISTSPAYLIAFEPREPHVDEDDLRPRGLPLIKLKSMVQGGRDVLLEAEVFGGCRERTARGVVLGERQQDLQHQRRRKVSYTGSGFPKTLLSTNILFEKKKSQ